MSPVRGSTMWCTVRPARRQARHVVLDVARPPGPHGDLGVRLDGPASRWSSPMPIRQPLLRRGPAVLMSPPRLTSTPQPSAVPIRRAARSAASALAVAPRSRPTVRGTITVAPHRVQRHPPPAGRGPRRRGRQSDLSAIDVRRSPRRSRVRRPRGHRRVDHAAGHPARAQCHVRGPRASSGPTVTSRARLLVQPVDLRVGPEPAARRVDGVEFARAATVPRRPAAACSVTTTDAVVPSAGNATPRRGVQAGHDPPDPPCRKPPPSRRTRPRRGVGCLQLVVVDGVVLAAAVPCARAAASTRRGQHGTGRRPDRHRLDAPLAGRSGGTAVNWASRTMIPSRGRTQVLHRVYGRRGRRCSCLQHIHGRRRSA